MEVMYGSYVLKWKLCIKEKESNGLIQSEEMTKLSRPFSAEESHYHQWSKSTVEVNSVKGNATNGPSCIIGYDMGYRNHQPIFLAASMMMYTTISSICSHKKCNRSASV